MIKREVINERIYRLLLNVVDDESASEIADKITDKVCLGLTKGFGEKEAIGKALLEKC